MKWFAWFAAAVLVTLGSATAQNSAGSPETIRVEVADNGQAYLVNSEGKLLYWYYPFGVDTVPPRETWSEPTRTWASFWEPVTVADPADFAVSDELASQHVFEVHRVTRDERVMHQLYWGGSETFSEDDSQIVAFWPLYTFKYDFPLSHYSMIGDDVPQGRVASLWEPALGDENGAPAPLRTGRLASFVRLGEGVGSSADGGP